MTKNVLGPTIMNWIKFNEDLIKLGLTSFVKTGHRVFFTILLQKHHDIETFSTFLCEGSPPVTDGIS